MYFIQSASDWLARSWVYFQPRASYHACSFQLGKPLAMPPAGVSPHGRPGSSMAPTDTMFRPYRRSRCAVWKLSNRVASIMSALT